MDNLKLAVKEVSGLVSFMIGANNGEYFLDVNAIKADGFKVTFSKANILEGNERNSYLMMGIGVYDSGGSSPIYSERLKVLEHQFKIKIDADSFESILVASSLNNVVYGMIDGIKHTADKFLCDLNKQADFYARALGVEDHSRVMRNGIDHWTYSRLLLDKLFENIELLAQCGMLFRGVDYQAIKDV